MASSDNMRGTARSFAPGTLDKTRQNIGPVDEEEAKMMARKLGGEVLPERRQSTTAPISRKRGASGASGGAAGRAPGVSASEGTARLAAKAAASAAAEGSEPVQKKRPLRLPDVGSRELRLMNQLMMSDEYEIKPDYGFLNFLFLSGRNKERLTRKFAGYRLRKHIEHLLAFVSIIRTIIQLCPPSYRELIATEIDLRFKFLRTVSKWNVTEIKKLGEAAAEAGSDLTVPMLIPLIQTIYHDVLTAYYIGEQPASLLIKDVFSEATLEFGAEKNKLQGPAKQAVTEWLYLYNELIPGLYPLLMRMCSTKFVAYPQFFTQQLTQIMQFVGLQKYDLLLPEKKKPLRDRKKAEEEQKKQEEAYQPGTRDEVVDAGLRLLDQMFPKAGFNDLDSHPDMYPYFQPLYNFQEGFNMLSPENGMQVELVLMKILEDLFHGCRNIEFHHPDEENVASGADSFTLVMTEWSYYLEDMFYKNYGDYLRNFMNSLYTQNDYANTQYGKENITNLFWRAKLDYLPHLQFSAPTLAKPRSDTRYRHLSSRAFYIRTILSALVRRIDENAAQKTAVVGMENAWSRYVFDIPNVVSRRMDVLLGAKRDNSATNATNANLIKYTFCVAAVLDWWINNPDSPAYTGGADNFYRSSEDGTPEFSVPVRSDQNQLFADAIKKAAASKAAAGAGTAAPAGK